jgi:DNA-binding CsgD family transcriptional regulator
MEKVAMRTSPALVATTNAEEPEPSSVDEGLRSFLGIISKTDGEQAPAPAALASPSEEVLVDIEVDGCRYLLIRMAPPDHGPIRLSPREHEIVRMVAKGHPNKVIADVLNISSWTVCTHLRRIFAKLGVGSRAAMVAQLLQVGVIAPDSPPKTRAK